MIEYSEATITNLIFHRISQESTQSYLSETEFDFAETDEETLKRIFLKPFLTSSATFEFKHDIDLELNPLFKLSQKMYADEEFIDTSRDIHQHLSSVSKHPNIKDGDLFIVKYNGITFKERTYEALGIYKIENKESFIETSTSEDGRMGMKFKQGIGSRKLDKACLIIFAAQPFTIFIIDNASTETEYWKNDFVNVDFKNDFVNNTNQFMSLTKTFITEQVPGEYQVTKADQIDLLNRSVEYFKSHETFEKEEFENDVFQDTEMIKSFQGFDQTYRENNEVQLADSFEISAQAVKKQARVFKSVLKLDKNFHIYIHGKKDLIERGVESDGRKFYKIYYEDES